MARRLLSAILLAALVVLPSVASARRSNEFAYRREQVWAATIRMLRVDYGFQIRDRDEDIGYLVFDYVEGQATHTGSVELIETVQDGQDKIRVVMQIPAMPGYIEAMLLERLRRKLLGDYGEPLRPPRRDQTPNRDEAPDEEPPSEDGAPESAQD